MFHNFQLWTWINIFFFSIKLSTFLLMPQNLSWGGMMEALDLVHVRWSIHSIYSFPNLLRAISRNVRRCLALSSGTQLFFFLNKVSIQIAVPVNCDRRWQFGALWVQLICKTAGSLTSAFPGSGSVRPGPWCCCKIQKGLEDASAWVEHQAKVWHWSVPKGKKCLLDVKNFSPAWCVDQSYDKKWIHYKECR